MKAFFTLIRIAKLDFGIFLVGFTAIVNYVAGYICIRTGKKNNSLQLIASGKHLVSDTYSTIGILAGLILIYFTGLTYVDSLVACMVAIIIIYTGYKIVVRPLQASWMKLMKNC